MGQVLGDVMITALALVATLIAFAATGYFADKVFWRD